MILGTADPRDESRVLHRTLTTQLAYNGDGVRTRKTIDGTTTEYVLDLATTLPVVISDTDAIYLYGLDIIAEQLAQSDRYYYVHDGLGGVRHPSTGLRAGLVDNTGQIAETYAYDPFGVPLAGNGVPNPYRFTGEAWDAEVELLYLRARYYQPETGRFITKDPWPGDRQTPDTLNQYVYVTNNPVNLVDPGGRNGEDPLDFLRDPPVVTYIHDQMIQNAQGPIVRVLAEWNRSWFPGMDPNRGKTQAYGLFAYMVWPGHEWDPKGGIYRYTRDYSHKIGDYWYYYDIWGNIMLGYLGTAAGFHELELLNGAGLVQVFSDIVYAIETADLCRLPRPRPRGNFYLPWAWDHPWDRVTTRIGIRLWKAHDTRVQAQHIIDAVKDAGDQIPRLPEKWKPGDFARLGL